ncbi:TPA: inverse autotransporter beta domain-containing protein, partial [Serratia liquefaciens]
MATGAAGNEVQQWLSQFGTARVQLNSDKNFSLKNSQLDLLVPLYEQPNQLVFTQGSMHRTDERTQANIGVGYRWFHNDWMLGGNTFLDHDLSRSHTRMGVGVEYWRDFLKLGVNSYLRLSNWKDSPYLTDYEERPANGWDVRAQAWLPAYPQVGGKLTYEQYYGNEVGLFGEEERQRSPHAITAGVNYTPVPLLTFNAEYRQGQAGQNDARVGVEMRYQLGVPWQQQIDPAAVAAMRSLAGSRHDLVERNNNIVLEYRKKEVISLHTAELVTGYAGEHKSLGVSVNSKYGLERIDWSAPDLLAAGGKFIHDGAMGYGVVLPAYRSTAGAVNTYTVSGVAVDTQGNASNQSETQVTVLAPVINEGLSSFLPASSVLLADGKGKQVLTLTLKDAQGLSVDVAESEIILGGSEAQHLPAGVSVSAPKKTKSGTYEITVTAGGHSGVVTLTPTVSGVALRAARVSINDMVPAAAQSTFVATPEVLLADNNATTTLTLTLKNAAGDVLSGLAGQLALVMKSEGRGEQRAADAVTLGAITESNQKGVYTATLKGKVAGKYTLVPEYNGSAIGGLSASVTLMAGTAVASHSSVAMDKESYVAGEDMTVTVVLSDASGNPVVGQLSALTPEAVHVEGATLKGGWSEKGEGVYTATYTAAMVGVSHGATLTLGGIAATPPAHYDIVASPAVATYSTIAVDKGSYTQGADITVTVALKDESNKPVVGRAADLSPAGVVVVGQGELKADGWKETSTPGTYQAMYTAMAVGTGLKATLTLNGSAKSSIAYDIVTGDAVASTSTIALEQESYITGDRMQVTVTLKDAHDNPVSGKVAVLTPTAVNVSGAASQNVTWAEVSAGSGRYKATYVAATAGTTHKAVLTLGSEHKDSATYT